MSHTGPIVFSNETAREQLVEYGDVITFRPSDRTTGETWWRKSRTGEKEGDVAVKQIREVEPSIEELEHYWMFSGFESAEDWQNAIAGLHGEMPDTGYLYFVTTLEENDGDEYPRINLTQDSKIEVFVEENKSSPTATFDAENAIEIAQMILEETEP